MRSRRRWWRRTPRRAIPKWPGIKLDLSEALLLEFDLSWCQLDDVNFTRAQFTGRANFEDAQFTGWTNFVSAQFTGEAVFDFARFAAFAQSNGAKFADFANFIDTRFAAEVYFMRAKFTGAMFMGDQFTRGTPPLWIFWRRPVFTSTLIDFKGARVASADTFRSVWPRDWAT